MRIRPHLPYLSEAAEARSPSDDAESHLPRGPAGGRPFTLREVELVGRIVVRSVQLRQRLAHEPGERLLGERFRHDRRGIDFTLSRHVGVAGHVEDTGVEAVG